MLSVKANKKRVQQHIQRVTGQVITLKDIHNIDAESKPAGKESDMLALLKLMQKEEGSIARVVTSEDNELQAIYY